MSSEVQPPLEQWSHEAVMKWFNSLSENDKKKFGAFFNDSKRFPLEADGKDLARMKEERFVALLGDVLGASLYEELQPLKAKGALWSAHRLLELLTPSCSRLRPSSGATQWCVSPVCCAPSLCT